MRERWTAPHRAPTMDARINAYRRQLAEQLGSIDMRAVPGFGTDGAPLGVDLAATMVLPRLRSTDDDAQLQSLGDVLAQHRHVVLHGEPGSGKTTLLSYLCLAHASDASELLARIEARRKTAEPPAPHHLVPVLLRLSSFVPKGDTASEFAAFVRDQLVVFPEPVIAAVMQALEEGRGLVCLDGLDEVSDDPTRRRIARSFEAWTRQHTSRCWVTTRKHGALTLADHFGAFEVVPFGWAEIREYLIRREAPREGDLAATEERAEAWLQRLQERPQLLELVRLPLLLVLALAVEAADHRLPVERVHLYESAITMLVRTWNEERRPDALVRRTGEVVDADEIRRALAAAALSLHEQRRLGGPVPRGELHRLLADELGTAARADGALEVFEKQAGLLVRVGDDLRFWHASFGEFLAATALAQASRKRPLRLLRTASSSEGREVVRMAISWVRTLGGDPQLASQLFDELLAEGAGGPWTRVFGAHVRLAVDVVRDGHPLDDAGFSRVVARVIDVVERAPLGRNTELLTHLIEARPAHLCPPELADRLLALIRQPLLLPPHVSAALMRWIGRLTPRSADARACCETMLARSDDGGRGWAALGLLRAGIVREDVCVAVTASLARRAEPGCMPETQLAAELAPERGRLLPGLRSLWDGLPAPSGPRPGFEGPDRAQKLRLAVATLLALLADEGEDLLTALLAEVVAARTNHETSSLPLRWLACRSEPARRRIGDALVDPDEHVRNAAVEALRAMLGRAEQADTAADAAFEALQRAQGRFPTPMEVLARIRDLPPFRDERTVLDSLCSLVEPDRGAFPTALMRRWSSLPAEAHELRWLLAGLLWLAARRSRHSDVEELAGFLRAATTDADPTIAVISANLLHEAWDRLTAPTRKSMMHAWIRGLQHPDVCERGEPVGPVCRAAWNGLRWRFAALDADGRTALRASLTGPHAVAATIAALLWLHDVDEAPRCRALLCESLRSDDLQRVFVAYQGLERDAGAHGPELLERWFEAAIRLALAGWAPGIQGVKPPTRALVELFLNTPCKRSEASELDLDSTEKWLAEHPDALELAVASIATNASPDVRHVQLLAACLRTAERVETLIARTTGEGSALVGGALSAVRRAYIFARSDTPINAALRSALRTLLQEALRSDDLATLRRAVQIGDDFHISAAGLSAARGLLLDTDDLAARRIAIRRWSSFECPPEQREASAHKYFGRGLVDLVAVLRPCLADVEPLAAIEAGLLLRRLTGEVEPLQATCHALLAAPHVEATQPIVELIERDARLGFLLDTERTRELHRAVGFARRACARTWAVLALDDLEAGDVPMAIRELFGEPDERGCRPGWVDWILQHRPEWLAQLEPRIVDFVAREEFPWVREFAHQLCERNALTPPILAAFTDRWREWLTSEWSSDDSCFADFVGMSAIPDAAALTVWREQLRSSEPELRERAALALGMSGAIDDELADALIDIYFAWRPPAAQRAYACLRRPECAAVFGARRRARASRWQTPEDASEILMLWSSEECALDRDVTLPLLRAASGREDAWAAFREAELLESIDGPAGLVAMTALAHRSTQAAAWLVERGQTHPAADARLWQALQHPEGSWEWELAAALLLPGASDDPRVPRLLAGVAATGDQLWAEKAIWLLAGISRERALVAILERLVHETGGHREASRWLMALSRGRRPGSPPRHRGPPPEREEADEVPTTDIFIRRPGELLRYASTLDHLVEALIELEPQLKLDLPGATATLLAGDAARWSELWRRAKVGEARPEEIDELCGIVDLRPNDGPGQRLARLYWRLKLPESALLEGDAPASTVAALARNGASTLELLVELLRHAFDDDAGLRRFMEAFGLRNALPGAVVPFEDLQYGASELLVRRELTTEAVELMSRRGLVAPEDFHAWNLAKVQR